MPLNILFWIIVLIVAYLLFYNAIQNRKAGFTLAAHTLVIISSTLYLVYLASAELTGFWLYFLSFFLISTLLSPLVYLLFREFYFIRYDL